MHMTKRRRRLFLVTVISTIGALSCGIVVKRDLSAIPTGQVGFDDMCGLQDYFDSLEAGVAKEPAVTNSLDLEGGDGQKTVRGGKVRLAYEGNFLLKHVRRVLEENYRRLPESLPTANKVEIEVRWAEKAGVKRVVTDQDAQIFIDGKDEYLPYHVCLSELIFGAPLYKQRQVLWGLPNPSATKAAPVAPAGSGPGVTGATSDGGAAPEAGSPATAPTAPTK
jgi:hypothetical protein